MRQAIAPHGVERTAQPRLDGADRDVKALCEGEPALAVEIGQGEELLAVTGEFSDDGRGDRLGELVVEGVDFAVLGNRQGLIQLGRLELLDPYGA